MEVVVEQGEAQAKRHTEYRIWSLPGSCSRNAGRTSWKDGYRELNTSAERQLFLKKGKVTGND
jgi:hypothetical protein